MVQEKYEVQLSSQEKGQLRRMIRSAKSSAQAITRARILLKIDEGWTAAQVAAALRHGGEDEEALRGEPRAASAQDFQCVLQRDHCKQ